MGYLSSVPKSKSQTNFSMKAGGDNMVMIYAMKFPFDGRVWVHEFTRTRIWPRMAILMIFCAARVRTANSFEPRECVVLIHGLGRTARSMKGLEWCLKKQGYDVVNETYA